MTAHSKKEASSVEDKKVDEFKFDKVEFLDKSRIYVILASKVKKADGTYYQMESGRLMAQVGHVVSRLKMFHSLKSATGMQGTNSYTDKDEVYEWLDAYLTTGVTVINLLARDENELWHVAGLADKALLNWVEFRDDNDEVYGKGAFPTTAIAIGPTLKEDVVGICDYIPLYR